MSDNIQITREIMWNVSEPRMMYILFFISLTVAGIGTRHRVKQMIRGRKDPERSTNKIKRFRKLIKTVFLQSKLFNFTYPGIFHGLIFYSFVVLFITTSVIMMDYDWGTSFFRGYLYIFLSIASEIGGVLILAGVFMAFFRRFRLSPKTIDTSLSDYFSLLAIVFLVITGFVLEGLRILATNGADPLLSPIGTLTGNIFVSIFRGIAPSEILKYHEILWWLHAIIAFSWIGTLPYTKFFHIFLIPANSFFGKLSPPGTIPRTDIEALMNDALFDFNTFNIGVGNTRDLTLKQRLDTQACISCGRCEEVCPPYKADHPFSPKKFIQKMKHLIHSSEYYWKYKGEDKSSFFSDIIENAIPKDFIWHCRTCLACVEVCPAWVEHLDMFLEIRRNEVSMKGCMPLEAPAVLKKIESLGNPYGPQKTREEWIASLDAPVLNKNKKVDILFWVGCHITFDPARHKIVYDVLSSLKENNISFAMTGTAECCCGDPLRVFGEENQYQLSVKRQIAELKKYQFKKILTPCPHCLNMLKNEYPQFGGYFEVIHHTEFFSNNEDIFKKKITPLPQRVTFHDPCYLGRYQKIYDAPRKAISKTPGTKIVEMENTRTKSLCCGGGGGHAFIDMKAGKKIGDLRVEQAMNKNVDTIITACPFCMTMLEDSIKSMQLENSLHVIDIASYSRNANQKIQTEINQDKDQNPE